MSIQVHKPFRIAVMDPVGFRGNQAQALQLVAEAIYFGSKQAGNPVEVVIGYLDTPYHHVEDFSQLQPEIKLRSFTWRLFSKSEAHRALVYAGATLPENLEEEYQVPDDGINQFNDCDLWLFISDRLLKPLLPIRPYILMVYDYIQRYEPRILSKEANNAFLQAARNAKKVLVTTQFTLADALQYAGIAPERVQKVPMLAPHFPNTQANRDTTTDLSYFIWSTNSALHKNHFNAITALRIYYEELAGSLRCYLTGVNSGLILKGKPSHLAPCRNIMVKSEALQKQVTPMGDLSDSRYRTLLTNARFLWHPARIDNGTFSVVEAACLGIPSLSSDYPAMREMDSFYNLRLSWCDPNDPLQIATKLKLMEQEANELKTALPKLADIEAKDIPSAIEYWKAIQTCL